MTWVTGSTGSPGHMVLGSLGRWVTKCDPVPCLAATNVRLCLLSAGYCMAMSGKQQHGAMFGPSDAQLAEDAADNPLWAGNSCSSTDEADPVPINTAVQHPLGTGSHGCESLPNDADVSAHQFTVTDRSQVRAFRSE